MSSETASGADTIGTAEVLPEPRGPRTVIDPERWPRALADPLTRVASLAVTLDRQRKLHDDLADLVTEFDRANLIPVVAEKGLLAALATLLDLARQRFGELVGLSPTELKLAVEDLEAVTELPSWDAGKVSLAALREQHAQLTDYVAELTEDRNELLLKFEDYRKLVTDAVRIGAMAESDAKLTAEVAAQLRDVERDIAVGRWDTTAVAVQEARDQLARHHLDDDGMMTEERNRLFSSTQRRRVEEERMSRRTELFLISAAPTAGEIPYKVMVRRPRFQAVQETNLHDDSSILEADHSLFKAVIDDIAAESVAGIRGNAAIRAGAAHTADAPPLTLRRAVPADIRESMYALDSGTRLEKVGQWMYSLLIPDAMQRLIDETSLIPLTITSNNPELPWELLHDGDDFLCLKRMFARMPAGQTFPRRSRQAEYAPPTTTRVLLIDSVPDEDLVEAAQEIDELEAQLKAQMHTVVTRISGPDVTTNRLTDELSCGSYDVIHYAGHAGFDPARPENSYLLTAGRHKFPAGRIQRLLQGHPVVFLNACESSRSAADAQGGSTSGIVAQAQGLASAFVYGGARACVGALWPVFDDSARQFARTFYTQLLDEHLRVGQALLMARCDLRQSRDDRVTWAAYALYGDPSFRIGEDLQQYHNPG